MHNAYSQKNTWFMVDRIGKLCGPTKTLVFSCDYFMR